MGSVHWLVLLLSLQTWTSGRCYQHHMNMMIDGSFLVGAEKIGRDRSSGSGTSIGVPENQASCCLKRPSVKMGLLSQMSRKLLAGLKICDLKKKVENGKWDDWQYTGG